MWRYRAPAPIAELVNFKYLSLEKRRRMKNNIYSYLLLVPILAENQSDRRIPDDASRRQEDMYIHFKNLFELANGSFNEEKNIKLDVKYFWGYGCWCIAHTENTNLAMRGEPKDEIDL